MRGLDEELAAYDESKRTLVEQFRRLEVFPLPMDPNGPVQHHLHAETSVRRAMGGGTCSMRKVVVVPYVLRTLAPLTHCVSSGSPVPWI